MYSRTTFSITLSFLFLALFAVTAEAQQPPHKDMMDDYSVNFYEVVDSAEQYFSENGTGKGSGFKGYNRWKNENESKFAPSGDRSEVDLFLIDKAYSTLYQESRLSQKTSFANGWVELGPWDANNVTSHYSPGIGRVETFWVNPDNDNQIFLGSRSGGFWRTDDGGKNWENTTDYLVASGVPALAVNPNDFKEILISVQHGGASYTHGIYRSTDGGTTWQESNFNPDNLNWGGLGDNERIYKIAYHPTVANKIFICSTKGLYVSEDNLKTWQQAFSGNTTDVAFHPSDDQIIYAYRNTGTDRNYLKRSSNGGSSFSNSGQFLDNSNARIFLSTSKSQPGHIYAASKNNIYKSSNTGVFFTKLTNPDEDCQGFAVSDLDVNNMIYGYVDLQASTDNGSTFQKVTQWAVQDNAYVHADLRTAQCINGVFYVGTDGYLAKSSDNGNTWTTLNDGTAIREFYAVGLSQGNYDVNMAGSQDNGTSILNETGWVEWNGGDGMEALVHPLNANWMIGSWQFGTRNYTRNGGLTRTSASNPEGGSNNANWEAPMLFNPLNSMQVWHFSENWFKGDAFGTVWMKQSEPGIGQIKEAAVSDLDSNVAIVSRNASILLTEDGGSNWKSISSGLPGYTVTDIAFDPKDDNTILVTYNRYQGDNKKIYISNDRGTTWRNITYNLGEMPLRTVVVDHSDSSYIYVGGEIGVYYKSMDGTEWILYDNELPNVTVKDLEIHYGSNTLRAASWGRGLWEYTLVGRNDFPSITHTSISNTPTISSPKATVPQYITSTIEYEGNLSEVKVLWSSNETLLDKEIKMQNAGGNVWESISPISETTLGAMIYFKVVATGNSDEVSETSVFNYKVNEAKYCSGAGSPGTGSDYISSVALNDYTNTSGQEYYGDFTNDIIELNTNNQYTLEVELRTHFDTDSVTAWIDYNGDLEFTEEEQLIMSKLNFRSTSSVDFVVPDGAVTDRMVRMRVRSQYYSNFMTPCDVTAGEVEDYSIKIEEGVSDVSIKESIEGKILPNPSKGEFIVNLVSAVSNAKYSIVDIQGKVVESGLFPDGSAMSIRTHLPTGFYTLQIESDNGNFAQKLILE